MRELQLKNNILATPCFWILFGGGIAIYAELMVNQLTNDYDGLWRGSFHNAGAAELSAGRWFWQYISRARFGTSADPYTSLITLFLFSVGLLLLFDLWKITDKFVIAVSGLLFIGNPTICCELSYRFTAPTYGVAFVLSILAVWCFEKIHKPIVSVLAGALCIACSMGSYQAYICCTTVACMTAILIKLSTDVNWRDILAFCGKSLSGGILGAVEYIVILNFFLSKNHLEMSGYQGADQYSLLNSLRCLPNSLYGVYQIFTLHFNGILYKINRMQGKHIFLIMFLLAFLLVLLNFLRVWKKNKIKAILYAGLMFLYPVASLSVMLIATNAPIMLQMACGPALFLTAMPCLFCCGKEKFPAEKTENNGRLFLMGKACAICAKCEWGLNQLFVMFMCIVLYGSVAQAVIDQNIMYEGRKATESIADMVVDKLLQEDVVSSEYRYVFVGTPVGSFLYAIDQNVEYANMYALYGAWFLGECSGSSWRGVIRNEKGINLDMVTGAEYERLSYSETVANMPLFPEEGSILLKDDIVYVKIGGVY